MSEKDLFCMIGGVYSQMMAERNDEDYVINRPQYDKFSELMRFFLEKADELGGEIVPAMVSPKEEHGGLTVKFTVFDVYGEQVEKFCNLLKACSAVSMDVTDDDKVCISCTVPNVFVKKED